MPGSITVAHGSMWVADSGGDAIHRVETDGSSARYALDEDSFPTSLALGADSALWFTQARDDEIGRINAAGDITEYDVPGDDPLPGAIVPGPDGTLYVAERNDNVISRVTAGGEFVDEYELPREHTDPLEMAMGVDGAIWISEFMGGVVSRMALDGTFTKAHRIPGGFVERIVSAPDGALWITQGGRGRVARLDLGLDHPVTASGTTFTARAGKSVNATVATFTDGDPDARARDYDVTIDWGDGDRSYGTVERRADGSFAVRGKHTYRRQGSRKVVVRITDGVGKGLDAKVTSYAIVLR